MSLVPRKQDGFRIPLDKIVIGDFDEAIKRIKKVKFLPDKIIVELVASYPAIKTSILMLNARIVGIANGHSYITDTLDLKEWHYEEGFIFYSEKGEYFSIPFKGAKKIIFTNGAKTKVFSKK